LAKNIIEKYWDEASQQYIEVYPVTKVENVYSSDGVSIQTQISDIEEQLGSSNLSTELSNHTSSTNNPHNVIKSQIGLGNVTNNEQATKTEFNTLEQDFTTLQQSVTTHHSNDLQTKHQANQISVDDSGSNFTSTNVEGALEELFYLCQ